MKRLRNYTIELGLVLVLVLAVGFFSYLGYGLVVADTTSRSFSGRQALEFAAEQMEFGPRVTGSEESQQYREWLTLELTSRGWDVVLQPFLAGPDTAAQNVIAISRNLPKGEAPVVIVGAHYDSRIEASRDPDPAKREHPTPGANRGASGPAILLELTRVLDTEPLNFRICLAFFDAAENSGIDGWEGNEGSGYFVAHLETEIPDCGNPRAVVIIDAVGNTDQLQFELSSSTSLSDVLRQIAETLEYPELFAPDKEAVESADHLDFVRNGFPTVYIFDPTYRFRQTTEDTLDKLRSDRLDRIGDTLEAWLELGAPLSGFE